MRALILAAILCLATAPLAAADEHTVGPATVLVYEDDQAGAVYVHGCEAVDIGGPWAGVPPASVTIHEECIFGP